MTDQTALPPVPGIVDLHARLAAGETLYGAFAGLGIARGGRDHGPLRLRLAAPRPRTRRRHRIGAAGQPPRDGRDAGGRPGPATVRRAAADRTSARSRRARDHGSPGGPARAGPRGDLVHALPAGWRARARALDARGGSRRARPHARSRRSTAGSWGSSRSSPGARSSTPPRSPPSMASTSCSSARPTCRTASGSPAASTIRAISTPSATSSTTAESAGKVAGILLRDASSLARHRDLGFRFIGLGSDGAFISDGARAVMAATPRLTLAALRPRPPPRAASRVRAPRAVWARSGR